MRRATNCISAALLILGMLHPGTVLGQAGEWNDARATDLAQRATMRRTAQLADTSLRDYSARARGYVTFLAQAGEGLTEPPRVVKADELGLEIFWRAPDQSKQRILGRRDTLLLPTDINYHRDHLGIVQNNFPDIIRLGDGDEVQDVPHPLSARGMADYDYRIADSLVIRLADRVIEVFQLSIKPRDDRQPRAVGAVFVERSTAQVVRMTFSFTRVALKDKALEDVAVILENGLIEDRYWLPRRQQIEIRRSGTWLDFPFRGIIRGRWEIRDYDINTGLPGVTFGGPEIVLAPPDRQAAFKFEGALLDGLPSDARTVNDADVRAVQDAARELVRAQALQRARGTSLQARSLSDFVRVNRVEGLALGAGLTQRLGGGVRVGTTLRYGTADEQVRGSAAIAWERASGAGLSLRVERQLGDVGVVPEVSTTRNSIAAQEFGSDWTNPYDRRQVVLRADLPPFGERRWRIGLEAAHERHEPSIVNATPARGRYEAVPEALGDDYSRLSLFMRRPTALSFFGTEVALTASLNGIRSRTLGRDVGRAVLDLDVQRPFGGSRLVLRTIAAGVTGRNVPLQYETWLGGPVTLPGYAFHSVRGRVGVSQRIEWQDGVPFPSIPLGRYGRVPGELTVAPFAVLAWTDGRSISRIPGRQRFNPAVGVGALGLFNLLRLDVARGLRDGRWLFSIDVARDFWRIM
ncbi:MAG TPA: hypothetical protein VE861_11800 [Gemmatimonadaceae bacterium]|nr:hypothetical protein [Gemmatimonadaceae bacterium]